jgi:hypothetical protein
MLGWERLLGPRFRRVLVANDSDKTELGHAPEYAGSNIGTARVVAQIFSESFFVPVPRREVRLYRYWRNGETLTLLCDG